MALTFHHLKNSLSRHKMSVVIFFIFFYLIGFIGIAVPFSHLIFIQLVPVALLLSLIALLIFHQDPFDTRTIILFSTICLSGYAIEVIGINTHLVFGYYQYGNALGIKIFNTPLLIGLNWLMLTYAGSAIAELINKPVWLKIIVASLVVLLYDIVLERTAPALDMWYWKSNTVPLQNYVAWFIIAVLFHSLIKLARVRTHNTLAFPVIFMQIVFFFSLIILFNLIK